MNDLNEGKVIKLIGYIMLCFFAWVTYFNFQGVFIKIIELFETLPLWWYLLMMLLFALAVVWSINLGEEEISHLEEETQKDRQLIVHRERCLRLLQYEVGEIPDFQFSFYCADLLRMLHYKEVRVKNYQSIRAKNQDGVFVYVKCLMKEAGESVEEKDLTSLIQSMERNRIPLGLVMTLSPVPLEVLNVARKHQILCLDHQALKELISYVTREGVEMLALDLI